MLRLDLKALDRVLHAVVPQELHHGVLDALVVRLVLRRRGGRHGGGGRGARGGKWRWPRVVLSPQFRFPNRQLFKIS